MELVSESLKVCSGVCIAVYAGVVRVVEIAGREMIVGNWYLHVFTDNVRLIWQIRNVRLHGPRCRMGFVIICDHDGFSHRLAHKSIFVVLEREDDPAEGE